MTDSKNTSLKELRTIPAVGKVVAEDLYRLGYRSVSDLKGENPEKMYVAHNNERGAIQDRCMLYTSRCAVYYADTIGKKQDPKKLLWWNWKD